MRLIDAESINYFSDRFFGSATTPSTRQVAFKSEIDLIPTVDAKLIAHAYWIEHKWAEEFDNLLISNFECSACHMWKREDSAYCPECGAKMDA